MGELFEQVLRRGMLVVHTAPLIPDTDSLIWDRLHSDCYNIQQEPPVQLHCRLCQISKRLVGAMECGNVKKTTTFVLIYWLSLTYQTMLLLSEHKV